MSETIKRWDLGVSEVREHFRNWGEWVRYTDHLAAIESAKAEKDAEIAAAYRQGQVDMREAARSKLRECIEVDARLAGCHYQQVVSIGMRISGAIVAICEHDANSIIEALQSAISAIPLKEKP